MDMNKLRTLLGSLLVLAFVNSFNSKAQCDLPAVFTGNTGVNMTVMLLPTFVSSLPITDAEAYMVALSSSGMVVGSTSVDGVNQTSLTLWGDDTFTPEVDGALTGEQISYQLVDGIDLYDISPTFGMGSSSFVANGIASMVGSTTSLLCSSGGETVLGCTDILSCNYNSEATEDDGSCVTAQEYYDCDNNCLLDSDLDGVCDELEVLGCTDNTATNYNSAATEDDGSCEYESTTENCEFPALYSGNTGANMTVMLLPDFISSLPITDLDAYVVALTPSGMVVGSAAVYGVSQNSIALWGDDSITPEVDGALAGELISFQLVNGTDLYDISSTVTYTTGGVTAQPMAVTSTLSCSGTGEETIGGCIDNLACNYSIEATTDDGTCVYADEVCETCVDGVVVTSDEDGDEVCDEDEVIGCMDNNACNFDPLATDSANCDYAVDYYDCNDVCLNDVDSDGVCDENEIAGCSNENACNYDFSVTDDDGTCVYPEEFLDCEGACVNDSDEDGICDELEDDGCTNAIACNFDPSATNDDGSCLFADPFYDCEGVCLSDFDGDGVCDPLEVLGCTDSAYLEYDPTATENNGSCTTLIVFGCMDPTYTEFNEEANLDEVPSMCVTLIVEGCIDELACNYNADANTNDGSCDYALEYYDCDENCLSDIDLDGVCDELEVNGCTDENSCNFNEEATEDDGSCYQVNVTLSYDYDNLSLTALSDIFGPATFTWLFGSTQLTELSDSLIATENGLYSVVVTDGEGCEGSDTLSVYNVGVTELVELPMQLYPNPANEYLNVDIQLAEGFIELEILNSIGSVVLVKNVSGEELTNTIQITLDEIPEGLYFLKTTINNRAYILPWIKQ